MQDEYKPLPKSKRRYLDDGSRSACEHCDSSNSVRIDYLRGRVCVDCDSSLDEMLSETDHLAAA